MNSNKGLSCVIGWRLLILSLLTHRTIFLSTKWWLLRCTSTGGGPARRVPFLQEIERKKANSKIIHHFQICACYVLWCFENLHYRSDDGEKSKWGWFLKVRAFWNLKKPEAVNTLWLCENIANPMTDLFSLYKYIDVERSWYRLASTTSCSVWLDGKSSKEKY